MVSPVKFGASTLLYYPLEGQPERELTKGEVSAALQTGTVDGTIQDHLLIKPPKSLGLPPSLRLHLSPRNSNPGSLFSSRQVFGDIKQGNPFEIQQGQYPELKTSFKNLLIVDTGNDIQRSPLSTADTGSKIN